MSHITSDYVCFACGVSYFVIMCSFWNAGYGISKRRVGTWAFLSFHALFLFVFVQCEICVSLSIWFSVYPRFPVNKESKPSPGICSSVVGLQVLHNIRLCFTFFFRFWCFLCGVPVMESVNMDQLSAWAYSDGRIFVLSCPHCFCFLSL